MCEALGRTDVTAAMVAQAQGSLCSHTRYLIFFLINLFILFILFILFLAALGLRCRVRAFSSCGEQGLLFVAVCGFLIAVASLVVEHGL